MLFYAIKFNKSINDASSFEFLYLIFDRIQQQLNLQFFPHDEEVNISFFI